MACAHAAHTHTHSHDARKSSFFMTARRPLSSLDRSESLHPMQPCPSRAFGMHRPPPALPQPQRLLPRVPLCGGHALPHMHLQLLHIPQQRQQLRGTRQAIGHRHLLSPAA
eukprot:5639399-Prymnesium_polylepis.3